MFSAVECKESLEKSTHNPAENRAQKWELCSLLFSKQASTPTLPLGRRVCETTKKGAPDIENPLCIGFAVLGGGLRPWSQTTVSEGARPCGRARSEFAQLWFVSLSALKSQRFLRFAIAMPIVDPRNRETLHSYLRVRWKVASDLRFRVAMSEPQNPFFLRDFWRFGSVNADIASDCDRAMLVR